MRYQAIKCPCGNRGCRSWLVEPVAAVQSVNFTETQARFVAHLLNALESDGSRYVLEGAMDYFDEHGKHPEEGKGCE